MKFFKKRKNKNDAPKSLRENLNDVSKHYKTQIKLNRIKVGIIVVAILFAIGNSVLSSDLLNPPQNHIALIKLEGIVQRGSLTADGIILSETINKAIEDEHVKVILIEANSPGGSPVQAEILHRTMLTVRDKTDKKIIFSIGELCASACLYASSAADTVYTHLNSLVGSVGVKLEGWGFDQLISKLLIERRVLTAGKNKNLLDPFMPQNEETIEHLKSHVLEPTFTVFKGALQEGRGNKLQLENPDLFTGYIWNGQDAVNLGFADAVKNHYEVREMLREEYKVDSIVNYTQTNFSLMKLLSSDFWAEVVTKAAINLNQQGGNLSLN